MKELCKILRTLRVLAIVLAFVLPTIAGAQSEIPLTTKSAEARKIFLEARQQFENIRFDEARGLHRPGWLLQHRSHRRGGRLLRRRWAIAGCYGPFEKTLGQRFWEVQSLKVV